MRLIDDAMRELWRGACAKLLYGGLLLACAGAAAVAASISQERPQERWQAWPHEWPREWDGRALRPLAPADVDLRFAARFPGRMARLADGERQIVMRHVAEPTRMLHPAADCYRASGYRIEAIRVERDADARDWRCFEALRDGAHVRVCERITDAAGRDFTDTSGWFWAALLGRSQGPWLAVTTAQPL